MAVTFLEPKKKIPWNKGLKTRLVPKTAFKKGIHYNPKTEFKKGIKPWNTGKRCPEISERQRGEKNMNWRNGATPKNMLLRKSLEYKLWRFSVFKRDNYICIWCGSKEKIQADHIKKFADYPELRFAIDNGRTLCGSCHKTTDNFMNKGGKR